MIIVGSVVGLCASTAAYFFARFLNGRMEIPLRESPDFSLKDLEELSRRDESQLPPLLLALLPIVLPVLLIAGYTVLDMALKSTSLKLAPGWKEAAATIGNKNIALVVSAIIAMGMLAWQKRASLKELSVSVQGALASGGIIILITSAGGAFGGIIQQSGVASLVRDLPRTSPVVILVSAAAITTAIRTAQGSATVSMITAVGVLGALADQLSFHPVYLALAIGSGSKPIAWMNDSGFWVICKMSGMTEAEGLKTVTPMSVVMGLTGLAATVALAIVLPLK
jgi:GntP family gluconate:H+ symporter